MAMITLAAAGQVRQMDFAQVSGQVATGAAEVANAWSDRCAAVDVILNQTSGLLDKTFDNLCASMEGSLGLGLDEVAKGVSEVKAEWPPDMKTAFSASKGLVNNIGMLGKFDWSAGVQALLAAAVKQVLKSIFSALKKALISVLRAAMRGILGCSTSGTQPAPSNPSGGGSPGVPAQLPQGAPSSLAQPSAAAFRIAASRAGVAIRAAANPAIQASVTKQINASEEAEKSAKKKTLGIWAVVAGVVGYTLL